MTLEINKANAVKAYNSADSNSKKLLEELLGKEHFVPQKITDRIKTFDDVLSELGQLPMNIAILLSYNGDDGDMISSQAHLKLTLIARVLNEGWIPDWSNSSQYKYVPYFKHKSGFGLAYDDFVNWDTRTRVGSRLCFKTAELAKYAATQFADIYNDFLTIK